MEAQSSEDEIWRQQQSVLLYEKSRWLKVTFNNETKRILDPPSDFAQLCSVIANRFAILKLLVEHPQRPQEIELAWGDKIVESAYDLQNASHYTQKTSRAVLHLVVTTRDKDVEDVEVEEDVKSGDADVAPDFVEDQNLQYFDDIEFGDMVMAPSNFERPTTMYISSQQFENQNLKENGFQLQPIVEEPLAKKNPQSKRVRVKKDKLDVRYETKSFKLTDDEPGLGTWISSFFSQKPTQEQLLRQLATVEAMNKGPRLENEGFATVAKGSWCSLQFKITNRTKVDWDETIYVSNEIGLQNYNLRVKARRVVYFTIEIYVPKSCVHSSLKFSFYFMNQAKNIRFGDTMIVNIKVNPAFLMDSESSEEEVIEAVVLSDEVVYSFAGQLADQGFGSFDQCLAVLTACNGNITQAKKALSKAIFTQKNQK